MQARRLTAQEGMLWLVSGYRLYRANPPLLIGLTFSYLFLLIVVSMIPVVGTVAANLGLPMLVVMVANGCRAIDEGHSRPLPFPILIDGLKLQRPALLRLGAINLAGSVITLLIGHAISGAIGAPDSFDPTAGDPRDMLLIMLPPMLVGSPLFLAFWFAPLLTAWQGVTPAKSMFFSFVACMRNWVAFGAFILAALFIGMFLPGMLIGVLAMALPFAAGLLSMLMGLLMMFFVAPVLMTSVYIGYREIFIHAQEPEAA